MMKLSTLLNHISNFQLYGSGEIFITGVSSHSKSVEKGNLFIAKKGQCHDGRLYIQDAIRAGASAILSDCFDSSLHNIVQIVHPQISIIEPIIAASYYFNPSQELFMVGVTGTNGKTTTSFIVRDLLNHFYGLCGLIGTIEYVIGKIRYPSIRTTPDVTTNHKMLREMLQQGCSAAVMEVTSHALDQGRVNEIDFDVAVFTNLTQDHLDYHGTMETYAIAKRKLFHMLERDKSKKKNAKWAIVNQDSSWTPYLLEGCQANILSYGIDSAADLQVKRLSLEREGTRATLCYQGQQVDCLWPLRGRFNVYNCLSAIGVLLSQSIPLEAASILLPTLTSIPGRMQFVPNELNLKIFIDYAHTDDALLKVLAAAKELLTQTGRLIVVFGCGGDRDRDKRVKMAQASEKYADLCIITSDNPRSEDPTQICKDIIKGFSPSATYQVEVDRLAAIQLAIEKASPDDVIVIAGKGHEAYQVFATTTASFDDYKVATQICTQLFRVRKTCFA